jgi:hypothetical protein
MKFQKLNIITGWFTFLVASITYILTIEPTVSFWDCGEFITSSFKLEVGHPPGAPFFMIIGRFFSLFAFGDVTKVPVMINILSALSSAFTILFLFWTITHIAKKIVTKDDNELTFSQKIAILGSGLVGALAYTFSDSFWFSAVEAEVYGMSSLFTAIVFWAILKWENVANEKYANRWIILIAYLMGLSIGIHLLNLLAIPAIVLVYYFKKYDFSIKGLLLSLGLSILILLIIMYGIIQGLVIIGSKFDLLFVNNLGLPFNSGFVFYIILLIVGVIVGLYFTQKYNKVLANTIILAFTVILIGYSSFALIMIRSSAGTPMNQNNPEDAFSFKSYLNREQYGNRPLVYGAYFNATVVDYEEGSPKYIQKDGKYEIADYDVTRIYDKEYETIFPRMYSDQPGHPEGYATWGGIDDTKKIPSFSQNLKYFFNYQVGFMYLRYFMWNFVGRQSDIQCNGNVIDGNWISGISFIDNARLGDQSKLPDYIKNNEGRNTYFFLPLILGIIGLISIFYAGKNGKRYFWIVLTFFLMTGFAIIVYLNQPPFQPRERDYSFAASFYAFAIYIGLGILGLFKILNKKIKGEIAAISLTIAGLLLVPTIMAYQNWDDHNRSGRNTAVDFAKNYLNSCAQNAIIFTNGDNDTFPLWYAQEVEEERTDIRVINLSYLNTDWYIDQMKTKAYISDPVPFSLEHNQYVEGTRDVLYYSEVPSLYLNEKYESSKEEYELTFSILYNKLLEELKNSKFPEIQKNDYELLSKGYTMVTPMQFGSMITELSKSEIIKKFELSDTLISSIKTETTTLLKNISEEYMPVDLFMEFITSDLPTNKILVGNKEQNFIPTTKIKIPVDKEKVIASGLVKEKDADLILDYIEWDFKKEYLTKSELMVIDLLATNNWERPVYFAITVGSDSYMNLEPYFQLDGMAYKLVPIKNNTDVIQKIGRIDSDILYDNIMNKFVWGNIENEKVYLDENNRRMLMNVKNNFSRLAEVLLSENKIDSAIAVLDKCIELIPNEKVPYNYYNLLIAEQYYNAGEDEKANKIISTLAEATEQEINFYWSLSESKFVTISGESEMTLGIIQEIITFLRKYEQKEMDTEWSARFMTAMKTNIDVILQFDKMQENEATLYQWYATLPSLKQQIISLYVNLINTEKYQ